MDLSASLRKAVESEAGAELYQNVSNAVLEALDRSCYNTKLSTADKVKFVNSIKAQAEQIVYTLMAAVKDASAEIQKTEIGPLKAREIQLMADVAEQRQLNRDLQYQLQITRDSLERIKQMHAENLDSCSKEYAEKIETKLAEASQNFTSEIQKLKANLKSPAGSPMAHVAQAQAQWKEATDAELRKLVSDKAKLEAEVKDLQKQLASNKASKPQAIRVEATSSKILQDLERAHADYVAKLKEAHREELYTMQMKNAKLQKEMTVRLDTLRLSSQDSGISLDSTGPRRGKRSFLDSSMGRTGPRRVVKESPLGRKVNFQVEMESDDDEDEMDSTVRTDAEKDTLTRALEEIDASYAAMHAKRKPKVDYE